MTLNKRSKNEWTLVKNKKNPKPKKMSIKKFLDLPNDVINLQEELQNNLCYFCLKNTCRNEYHLRNENKFQDRCNSIFRKYINNPGKISPKLNKKLYNGIVEYMKDFGVKNPNNIYITSCSACLLSKSCNNVKCGFSFTLELDNKEYTLCFKDPLTCRNKIQYVYTVILFTKMVK